MTVKEFLLSFGLLAVFLFCLSWCAILDKNQKQLMQENASLKQQLYDTTTDEEKQIRLLKQDVLILDNKLNGEYGK